MMSLTLTFFATFIVHVAVASDLLSLRQPTFQSSIARNGHSYLAVDGNLNQNLYSPTCSHTNFDAQAWWRVDLRHRQRISHIKIYNRGDCCGERLARFDVKIAHHSQGPWRTCYYFGERATTGQILDLPCVGVARYLMVQLRGTNYLTLCEVEVYGSNIPENEAEKPVHRRQSPQLESEHVPVPVEQDERIILSEGKQAFQSSTESDFYAHLAVDGNQNTQLKENSCSRTRYQSNPWWMVDLGHHSVVEGVRIVNRGDCCGDRLGNFKIQLGQDNYGPWTTCSYYPASLHTGQMIDLPCHGSGRLLRIQIVGSESLTLCEVQVFGARAV